MDGFLIAFISFTYPISIILLGAQVRFAPSHEMTSYLFLAILVLITIAFAYALHLLVEVPALRWSRQLKSTMSSASSAPRPYPATSAKNSSILKNTAGN